MNTFFKVLGMIGTAIATVAFIVALQFGGIHIGGFLQEAQESVRTSVFRESRANVEGKITHLNRLRREFQNSNDAAQRTALKDLILAEADTIDFEDLSPSLQIFVTGLR